jgi:hypothetical protein
MIVNCPKCKARVPLEERDQKLWYRSGFSVPSECTEVIERIIRDGAQTDPLCPILEREKKRVSDEYRKSFDA